MLGKAVQPQFRQLCAKETVKPTKFLFGENVTQLIKDIQVKNKIAFKDDTRGTTAARGRYSGKSFLGYGRGRPQGRAPRGRYPNQYQKGQHNNQYQNQYQNVPGKKRH